MEYAAGSAGKLEGLSWVYCCRADGKMPTQLDREVGMECCASQPLLHPEYVIGAVSMSFCGNCAIVQYNGTAAVICTH